MLCRNTIIYIIFALFLPFLAKSQGITDTCDVANGGKLELQFTTEIEGLIRGSGYCIQRTNVNGGLEMIGANLSIIDGDTVGQVLRWTGTDWETRLIIFPPSTGGVDTAYNALTKVPYPSRAVKLGGPHTEHTTVTGVGTYDLTWDNLRNLTLESQRTSGVAYSLFRLGSTAIQGVDMFHYNEANNAIQAGATLNYSTGNVWKIQSSASNVTTMQQYDSGAGIFQTDITASDGAIGKTFRVNKNDVSILYLDPLDVSNEAAFVMVDTFTGQLRYKSPADFAGLYGVDDSTWVKDAGGYSDKRITDPVSRSASATAPFYDKGGAVFNVAAYGIYPGADETADFLKLLDTLKARGGGRIVFNTGKYIFTGKILVPSIAQAQTRNGATVHRNVDMVWQGAGAYAVGYSNPDTFRQKGTVISLTYAGDSLGRIDTRGLGKISIKDITFDGGGSTTTPMFKTSNTTLDVSNCAFMNAGMVFQLGSNGVPTEYWSNGPTECFQGYGSVFQNNYFNQVGTGFYLKENANGIIIRDNTFWWQCSGYAAIRIEPTGAVSGGNSICNNLIEMNGYQYGIVLGKTAGNTIIDNNFFDADGTTTALIYHKNYPYINSIRMGFYSGGTITQFVDDAADGTTHYFPMLADDTARVVTSQVFYRPIFLNQDSLSVHDTGADSYYWKKAAGSNTLTLGMDLVSGGTKEIVSLAKNVSGSVIQAYDVDNTDIRVQADGIMYYAAKDYAILNDSIFTYADNQTAIEKNAALIASSEAATPGDPTGYGTGIEIRPLFNRTAFASLGAVYETSNPNDNIKLVIHQKGGGTANKRAEFGSNGTYLFGGATSKILTLSNSTGESSFFRQAASPNGVLAAYPGDLAQTSESGTGNLYIKKSGSGTSTGWGQVTTDWTWSGTTNYIPKWTGASAIGNSILYESSGKIGFSTTSPQAKIHNTGGDYGAYKTGGASLFLGDPNYDNSGYFDKAPGLTAVFNAAIGVTSDLGFYTYNGSRNLRALLTHNGRFGIGSSSPTQTLHVEGTARITGSDGTATTITGRDADGDISSVSLGSSLALSSGTLAIADVAVTPGTYGNHNKFVEIDVNSKGQITDIVETAFNITTYASSGGPTTTTLQHDDYIVEADPTAGDLTIELGSQENGRVYHIFGCCNLTNNIILSGSNMKFTGAYGVTSSPYTLAAGEHLEIIYRSSNSTYYISKK